MPCFQRGHIGSNPVRSTQFKIKYIMRGGGGRRSPVEDEYDLDHKINDVVDITKSFIQDLIYEVGIDDYKKIAKAVVSTHMDTIVDK